MENDFKQKDQKVIQKNNQTLEKNDKPDNKTA